MKKVLKDIFNVAKTYKNMEIVGFAFTFLYTCAVFISPIVSRYLIDDIIPSNSKDKLKYGIFIFFIGCICQPIFGYIKNIIFMKVSENITILFREKMYNKVIDAPMDFFDKSKNGAIVSRISNDGRSISEFVTNFFVVFLKNIVQIIIIFIGMFLLSKDITLIVLLLFGIYFIVNLKISKQFTNISKGIQESYDKICIKINRSVGLISTIKAFNQEEKEKKEFKEIIDNNYHQNIQYNKLETLMSSISNGIMIASLSIVYGLGSLKVMEGKSTVGTIVALGLYFQLLVQPIYELLNSNVDIRTILPIFDRINEYNNLKTERIDNSNNSILKIKSFEFVNVSFSYNNGEQVLNNINLNFPSKGLYAFVGDSGAGKSSLIKLLSGLYDSYEGEIKINSKNLKEYGVREVRKSISLVSQDIELLNDSIRNNIKMDKKIDDYKITKVLKSLNLQETIENMESGYDTIINERVNLSGGEKQRISIARALVKESDVYIFDEPTAALDTINEKQVKKILEELSKDKLVIIITHNLSLLNRADCIHVMKQGGILEKGNYKYLNNPNTYFAELMDALSIEKLNTNLVICQDII